MEKLADEGEHNAVTVSRSQIFEPQPLAQVHPNVTMVLFEFKRKVWRLMLAEEISQFYFEEEIFCYTQKPKALRYTRFLQRIMRG